MNSNIPEKFHDDEFPLSVVDVCNEIIQNGPGEDLDAPNRILIAEKGCVINGEDVGVCENAISYNDRSETIMVHVTDVARVFGNTWERPAMQEACHISTFPDPLNRSTCFRLRFPEEYSHLDVISTTGVA